MPVQLQEGPSNNKLQLVQGLRGLAALTVLLLHAGRNNIQYVNIQPFFSNFYAYGWLGVYFFFVLSGFIITYVHLKNLESGRGIRLFLRKRFIRIYPLYWMVATVMLLYYVFIKESNAGTTINTNSPGESLYLLKSYLLFPTAPDRNNFIVVAWSLSYEIWFYIVFAVCIQLRLMRSIYLFFAWGLLICINYYGKMGNSSVLLSFILNPLILYFLSGCLVAYLLRKMGKRISRFHFTIAILGICIVFYFYSGISGAILSEFKTSIGYTYLFTALFSILIWRAASVDEQQTSKGLFSNTLSIIGDASYSIYLTHPSILMLLYKGIYMLLGKHNIVVSTLGGNSIFVLALCFCIFAGIVIHIFVEKPILNFLNKKSNPKYHLV